MTSIDELRNLIENFRKEIKERTEDFQTIEKLIFLYEKYIKSPETLFPDSKVKSYFIHSFSSDIIQVLLNLQKLSKPEYKENIMKLLKLWIDLLLEELNNGKFGILEFARPIFAPESPLYANCFEDIKNIVYKYTANIEAEWKVNLKVGDKIDVLKEERAEQESIEAWAIATITEVYEDKVKCTFDGIPESKTEEYLKEGGKIFPLGTRTQDWGWRDLLEPGNQVDAFDTQGKWFLGTVLETKVDKDNIRILKIGFRVYLPDGSKTDENNKKYEGWSSKYDTWLPAYSIQIQKPHLITKRGTVYCRVSLDNESPAPDDSGDVLQNHPCKGDNLFLINRYNKCYSSFYLELMNYFAEKRGFDCINNLMKRAESIEKVFAYLNIVSAPHMLYHRIFVNTKIAQFVEILLEYMSHIPEDQIRCIRKKALDEALGRIEDLMRRVYTAKAKSELLIKLRITIAISLLGADQLEKRIQAIKIIAKTCKAAKASQEVYQQGNLPTANDSAVLSKLLRVPQLIGEIFGKRSHIELIQRSTEILKFLLNCSKITKDDFNIIWECCTRDEQSKIEIFKVIVDSSNLLPNDLIELIAEKYTIMPATVFKDQDAGILCELVHGYSLITPELLKQMLDLLWKVVREAEDNLSEETINKALCRFCDVITTPSRITKETMMEYFSQCYKMLEEGNNSMLALKILRKSLVQLPCIDLATAKKDLLFNILSEGNVIENFMKDLERYYANAKEQFSNNVLNLKHHNEEIHERKEFLLFLINFVKYKLNLKELKLLWNILIESPVIPENQIVFYSFFKELLSIGIEEHVTSMSELCDFFVSVICNEENNFQQLSLEGMYVIEVLLITVNKVMEKLVEIGTIRKKYYEYKYGVYGHIIGPMPPEYKDDSKEDEIEFRVKVLPSEIVGSSILWKIMLEAKNEQVATHAIELINKIYIKLSEEVEDRITEISNSFISTAIAQLRLCYQKVLRENLSRSNEIVKMLRLIEEMLDDSEKKGNGGITPLSALPKGQDLKLTIQNFTLNIADNEEVPSKVELTVHSKTTYWQLTILVARKLKMESEALTLKLPKTEVSNRDHAKTLEELKVADGDILRAISRSEDLVPRLNLTKNGILIKKAKDLFIEIFNNFSKGGKMDVEDYTEFARACLGEKTISSSYYQIKEIFKEYDKGSKGYLVEEEFLNFYEYSSVYKENTVWCNLRELGYGPDLKKVNNTKKDSNISVVECDKLPRYLLANNPDYISFIFSLASIFSLYIILDLGGEIGDAAWNLTFKLSASKIYLDKINNVLGDESVNWKELFDISNPCELIYYLYLIQALVSDGSDAELAELRQEAPTQQRESLRLNILKRKVVEWFITQTKTFKNKFNQELAAIYARMTITLITSYLVASMKANNKLPKEFHLYQYKIIDDENKKETDVCKASNNDHISIKIEYIGSLEESFLCNYQELSKLLTGELGLSLLASVDYLDLAKDLVQYLDCLLCMEELTSNKVLLVDLIIFLLKILVVYQIDLYDNLSQVIDIPKLLLKGISFASSIYIRDIMQQLAYFLAANIRHSDIKKLPLIQILIPFLDPKVLFNNRSATEPLYELVILLLNQYEKLSNRTIIDTIKKFDDIMEYFRSYYSSEISQFGPSDTSLLGLLQLAAKLISISNSGITLTYEKLIKYIEQVFYSCLFPDSKGQFKCKSIRSRWAAYELIINLSSQNVKCWLYLINNCLLPLRSKVSDLTTWGYSPSNHERSCLGYTGLKNIGCICYINSMLQQFFFISPFRNAIVSVKDGKEPKYAENGIDDNLLHQFQRTFVYLLFSTRKDFNPLAFCYSFKEFDGQPTNTAIQHDAHEFLNILFERLEQAFKNTAYTSLMQSVFGGKLSSQVKCKNCGYISATYEDYYTLSLEIKNLRNLDESLERFITESSVTDYWCRNCRTRVDVTKRTLISTLPNMLIIHLQRFTYNFDTFMNEKIHTRLEFAPVLDMTNYTEEGSEAKRAENVVKAGANNIAEKITNVEENEREREQKESKDELDAEQKKAIKDKEYYMFKLVGIVMHNGNADAGHYYSYININRAENEMSKEYLHAEKDRWIEFNDSHISEFNFSKLEAECFGGALEDISTGYMEDSSEVAKLIGGRSKSAYMLIYEKQKKESICLKTETNLNNTESINSLECDNIAISRVNSPEYHEEKSEPYEYFDFHRVPAMIAPELLSEVTHDNEKFLYEQLVYEKNFVKFICGFYSPVQDICDSTLEPAIKNSLRSSLCSVVEKFFFEIASRTALDSVFPKHIGNNALRLFESSPEESENLLKKLVKEPGKLIDLLLKCPEKSIRNCIYKTILGAYSCVMKSTKEESKTLIYSLVNIVTGLVGYELSVQWNKFKQFFKLLRDMIKIADDELIRYLMEKDMVACLLDFFLEKNSPLLATNKKRYEMGNISRSPDFGPLMEAVSFLVMKCKFPLEAEGTSSLVLSESAMKCLQSDELLPKFVKCNGKIVRVSKLITRMCLKNKKFTKKICKLILKGIDSYESSKVQYFELMAALILLQDEYKELRLEYLLGYPQPIHKTNYGLADVCDIDDDVNNYFTPLEYCKSVLQFLWSDRKHSEKLVTQGLKILLTLCIKDKAVCEYLKRMPPPCYLFGKYTDWIPKFLNFYSKGYLYLKPHELKERDELIEKVRKLYKKYEDTISKEEVNMLEPYMVGHILDLHELPEKRIATENVQLTVIEIVTEVYPSKPMGNYNAALTGQYLINHFKHIQLNANRQFELTIQESVGEHEKNNVKTSQVTTNTELLNSIMNSDTINKSSAGINEIHKDEKKEESELSNINPQNVSVDNVENKHSIEQQIPEKDVELPKAEDSDNIKEDNQGNNKEKEIPLLASELEKESKQYSDLLKTSNNTNNNVESVKEITKSKESKNETHKSLTSSNDSKSIYVEVPYKSLAVFHRIDIINTGQSIITAKFKIKPTTNSTPNFYYPVSTRKCNVSQFNTTLLTLQRISLDREMSSYEIILDLKKTEYNVPIPPRIEIPQPPPNLYETNLQNDEKCIPCPICTFLNKAGTSNCTLCLSSLFKITPQRT